MLISADEAKINKDVHPPCHAVAQISTGKISEKVVTRSSIQAADLLHLIERNIAAVRIPGYYDVGLCGVVSKLLLANPHRGSYVNAPMIGRVGQAFFESQACETSQRRYTAMAVNWIRDMRASCAPYLSPIDKVRLELDET